MSIRHAVWPTPPPTVCTAFWSQAAWDRFAERYRPRSYTGGAYDIDAWTAYVAEREAAEVAEFYQKYKRGDQR